MIKDWLWGKADAHGGQHVRNNNTTLKLKDNWRKQHEQQCCKVRRRHGAKLVNLNFAMHNAQVNVGQRLLVERNLRAPLDQVQFGTIRSMAAQLSRETVHSAGYIAPKQIHLWCCLTVQNHSVVACTFASFGHRCGKC